MNLEGKAPETGTGRDPIGRRFAVRRTAVVAVMVTVAFVAAACSSSKKTTTLAGTSGTTAAAVSGLDDAKATVAKYSTAPTAITATQALTTKPPAKKVAFVVCADPSCVVLAGFLKQATTALGWSLTTINATATDPGSAIQQAIDAGVDYIAETGSDVAQFKPQMDNAKAKGIPIFQCYATDVPGGTSNNIYSDCYDSSGAAVYAKALVDWLIADSNGSANVVAVTLPAFPILTAQVDAAKAEAKNCSGCKLSTLDLTVADLAGGKVPTSIVSYLQTNPSVNYVYLTYNGLATGVAQAIKAAGLSSKVKLIGTQGNKGQLQDLINGSAAMWSALPQEYSMWVLADQMARLSVGQWTSADERKSAIPPFYLVTSADQAKSLVGLANGWRGPDGFQDAYKKLWGV